MFAAIGRIKSDAFVEAAISLSNGVGACHEYAQSCPRNKNAGMTHHDGWGAVYRNQDRWECLRGALPIGEDWQTGQLRGISTGALVIHVRNASIQNKTGIGFVHPVRRDFEGGPGYFFHNGFAPDAYSLLNRTTSQWDSEELCDWLMPALWMNDIEAVKKRLSKLPSSTTAANFIFVTPDSMVICNWFSEPHPQPKYFTMWYSNSEQGRIFASEPLPQICPFDQWTPMENQTVQVISLQPETSLQPKMKSFSAISIAHE